VKRLIVAVIFLFISSGLLYSSRRTSYQLVDVYVCENTIETAELAAKVKVSRKQLLTVSYCTCEGISEGSGTGDASMKCDPPKDAVYSCTCIGKNQY